MRKTARQHLVRVAFSVGLFGTLASLMSTTYADPDVMPRVFGHCAVGPSHNDFDAVIVFCGEIKTEPSIVIGTTIDDGSPKKRVPILYYYDLHNKDINKNVTFDFGSYHYINGWVTIPPGAWFIDEGRLSIWTPALQALMSAETFSATSDSGTSTVDLTGFSQAFQYFASEYKRIHHQPFPAWH
ncbi:hypothetical protein [Komagataeibacter medellinensis]|uniref:Uncharacterized protein n=1 Tax=Komagataeibacter medellinensis (strain NBRC 3288 / BCRC 11682 / LMG 1693 / Kondo 51) TaxID=634177 RepID=G2I7A6_KOMMN|nr:hypothetical protein [Komagataeibacter medellinensis]BAK84003.1 hypothetical protein GLX_15910 [Komagataeibacter medellinensis NBRC 3288]